MSACQSRGRGEKRGEKGAGVERRERVRRRGARGEKRRGRGERERESGGRERGERGEGGGEGERGRRRMEGGARERQKSGAYWGRGRVWARGEQEAVEGRRREARRGEERTLGIREKSLYIKMWHQLRIQTISEDRCNLVGNERE